MATPAAVSEAGTSRRFGARPTVSGQPRGKGREKGLGECRPGRLLGGCAVLLAGLGLSACGGTAAPGHQQSQAFLNVVYSQAPDISTYRTGTQLISLGVAVCDDLRAGASVQQLADRLSLMEGSVALPPGDLGVVMSSAVATFCPQYRKLLG